MINTRKKRTFRHRKKMWTNEADFYSKTLSENVILIFTDIGYISKKDAIEAINQEYNDEKKWEFVAFKNEKIQELTSESYIISYMVKSKWNYSTEYTYVIASSIYTKVKNCWTLHLHQQTSITPKMYGT
jgi:hypothetical protein